MNTLEIMKISPIIPVIAIEDENDALPLANALIEGGINIMEITLRTDVALKAIELISKKLPQMNVGVGTVCNEIDLENSINVGANFIFSPGINDELIQGCKRYNIPFIPGVSSATEVMFARNKGIKQCKLFPAISSGGIKHLKALAGPFHNTYFCPTGGINKDNFKDFLNLKNVLCVGGSWIAPKDEIKNKNFKVITKLCQEALEFLE
ncbi:MAG: bifunctional 4-hydroxy-2-oxoglutarate aldolase/2-dehydro-3-deoxy-phosphogluconate aldolase [Epsilonproteobacteria bacterium]|nr:bifunctional 4-hydroxy-2-oxoglutarate aldolase/2-dehydro-3-deoxy-phosphogluconate aldolase [Campylobacterota bacterium]